MDGKAFLFYYLLYNYLTRVRFMRLKIEELIKESKYILLDKVNMKDNSTFISKYFRKFTLVTFCVTLLMMVSFYFMLTNIHSVNLSMFKIMKTLIACTFTAIGFIPVKKLIQCSLYRLFGAKDIRFYRHFKRLFFSPVADNFVLCGKEYTIILLAPIFTLFLIALCFSLSFPNHHAYGLLMLLLSVLINKKEMALLNYLWLNKEYSLFIYSDTYKNKSYFYACL